MAAASRSSSGIVANTCRYTVSTTTIVANSTNTDRSRSNARHIPDVAQIAATVVREARDGDVIAVLSNGGFGGLHELLLEGLAARARQPSRRTSAG